MQLVTNTKFIFKTTFFPSYEVTILCYFTTNLQGLLLNILYVLYIVPNQARIVRPVKLLNIIKMVNNLILLCCIVVTHCEGQWMSLLKCAISFVFANYNGHAAYELEGSDQLYIYYYSSVVSCLKFANILYVIT